MPKKIDMDGVRTARENLAKLKADNPDLRQMTLADVANAVGAETFSPEECAELLGIHVESVRRLIRQGDFPAAKLGGRWRTSKADLERYYRENGGGQLFASDTPDDQGNA